MEKLLETGNDDELRKTISKKVAIFISKSHFYLDLKNVIPMISNLQILDGLY